MQSHDDQFAGPAAPEARCTYQTPQVERLGGWQTRTLQPLPVSLPVGTNLNALFHPTDDQQ